MIAVGVSYWAYAAIQSLLFLICVFGAGFYAFWSFETRHAPRPALWWLLPFIAAMDVALAVDAGKWILVRAVDSAHSVAMIHTVKQSQSYLEYAVTRGFLLTIVALQVWPVWRVREHDGRKLAAIFIGLMLLSLSAAAFHHRQIVGYCAAFELACRTE
jgi:hypothetical protein